MGAHNTLQWDSWANVLTRRRAAVIKNIACIMGHLPVLWENVHNSVSMGVKSKEGMHVCWQYQKGAVLPLPSGRQSLGYLQFPESSCELLQPNFLALHRHTDWAFLPCQLSGDYNPLFLSTVEDESRQCFFPGSSEIKKHTAGALKRCRGSGCSIVHQSSLLWRLLSELWDRFMCAGKCFGNVLHKHAVIFAFVS